MMNGRKLNLAIWLLSGALGWLGLVYLVYSVCPQGVNRGIFFALVFISVLATTFGPAYYLQLRFARESAPRTRAIRALRQGAFIGGYIALCAWLQMLRALNWANALVILGILVLLEGFFLVRG